MDMHRHHQYQRAISIQGGFDAEKRDTDMLGKEEEHLIQDTAPTPSPRALQAYLLYTPVLQQ